MARSRVCAPLYRPIVRGNEEPAIATRERSGTDPGGNRSQTHIDAGEYQDAIDDFGADVPEVILEIRRW